MKLPLRKKFVESENNAKKYYAVVEKDGKMLKVEIAKKQYNRTEIGDNIEIKRFVKFEQVNL